MRITTIFLVLTLAACATPPRTTTPSAPTPTPAPGAAPVAPAQPPAPPPPPTQQELDQAGQRDLDEGVALYDKGDYNAAISKIGNSPAIAAAGVAVRMNAYKYLAFNYCVTRRTTQCAAQFEAALKLDPAFDLTAAERGHPLWGPVFERVKKAHQAPPKR